MKKNKKIKKTKYEIGQEAVADIVDELHELSHYTTRICDKVDTLFSSYVIANEGVWDSNTANLLETKTELRELRSEIASIRVGIKSLIELAEEE